MLPLYKRYKNEKPVGVQAITNTAGLIVFQPLEEDKPDCDFVTAWTNVLGDPCGYHRSRVHYTLSGRAYLRKGQNRYYLDEIMRV